MNALGQNSAFTQERDFKLREERKTADIGGWLIRVLDNSFWEFRITDLSYAGCRITTNASLKQGEILRLGLPRCGPTEATVRWTRGDTAGLRFESSVPSSSKTPRQSERHAVDCPVMVRRQGRRSQIIDASDVSLHGCSLRFTDAPRVGEIIWVKLAHLEALETEVRWVTDFTCGASFRRPLHPAVFDLVLVRLGETSAPQSARLRF